MRKPHAKLHNYAMFDWNDLKHLLAVARQGSTNAAARELAVNQSTVHRRLAELERRIGLRLVHRHPTGYRLTEVGEQLLPLFVEVAGSVSKLERGILSLKNELTGTVRLTCPEPVLSRIFSSGFIDRFHQRYPALKIEFVTSDRYVDLAKGEADVAFRSGEPNDERLVGRKIADSTWAVYASRDYVARRGQPRSLQELSGHDLIGFDGIMENHRATQWLAKAVPGARIVARNNSVLGVVAAIKSGLGVAPLPIPIGDAEEELLQVLPLVGELTRAWYLLCHPDHRTAPRISAFIDFVVEELPLLKKVLGG
ncbi:LysR family transcriptional regulator [Mesorhizobium sp. AR10]|uniref:LysR family transcriptional regulator n=1 Tax=Mesorhizobium sp. AR10 TaxID=2865839 RepID=UPI00215FA2AA|nr:LysR family transcriptional regulator [Mesorhizobium sp. AR10]UVK38854.1 LysR family transcriptional regulator [Mesorhizobium sp. AR10]